MIPTTLNRSDSIPLHAQLKTIIQEKISTSEWAPDTMIPSEIELSKTYGISRSTVRTVLTQFVFENVLYRIQGKGTFVNGAKYEISSTHYMSIHAFTSVETKSKFELNTIYK